MGPNQFPGQTLQPLPGTLSGPGSGEDQYSILEKIAQLLYNISTGGGGGGGTPGGSNMELQFNDGGVLNGIAGSSWNKATKQLQFTGLAEFNLGTPSYASGLLDITDGVVQLGDFNGDQSGTFITIDDSASTILANAPSGWTTNGQSFFNASLNGDIAAFQVASATKCTISTDGSNHGLFVGSMVAVRGGDDYYYANARIRYHDGTGQLQVFNGSSGGGGDATLFLYSQAGPNVSMWHDGTNAHVQPSAGDFSVELGGGGSFNLAGVGTTPGVPVANATFPMKVGGGVVNVLCVV